jgi:uncharacterized membrane protein YqhA
MHSAFALLSVAGAGLLLWQVIRRVETATPSTAETVGLVVVVFLLLMLAAGLLVVGPVSGVEE